MDPFMTDRQASYIMQLLDTKIVPVNTAAKIIEILQTLPDAGANGLEDLKVIQRPE